MYERRKKSASCELAEHWSTVIHPSMLRVSFLGSLLRQVSGPKGWISCRCASSLALNGFSRMAREKTPNWRIPCIPFHSSIRQTVPSVAFLGLPLLLRRTITLLSSFNVVDNSKLGKKSPRYKKPYLIGFYRKRRTADIGDIIKVAVQGKTCKALVVGTRKPKNSSIPRYDNNNIVLVDDNLSPLGTRIKGPLPTILRKHRDRYSKVLALATRFI